MYMQGMYMPGQTVSQGREGVRNSHLRNSQATQEELVNRKERLEEQLQWYQQETNEWLDMPAIVFPLDKSQVNVHSLLQDWSASLPEAATPEMQMDQVSINKILQDIDMQMDELHVLGLAAKGVTDDNVQAVASVGLQSEWYGNGNLKSLLKEQGLPEPKGPQVPVVYIDAIVTSPKEGGDTEKVQGELVHRIIEWARKNGRLVEVNPPSEEMAGFYASLGFEPLNVAESTMMVYRGKYNEGTRGEGNLVEFDLSLAQGGLQAPETVPEEKNNKLKKTHH
jgi:hypothetical protein